METQPRLGTRESEGSWLPQSWWCPYSLSPGLVQALGPWAHAGLACGPLPGGCSPAQGANQPSLGSPTVHRPHSLTSPHRSFPYCIPSPTAAILSLARPGASLQPSPNPIALLPLSSHPPPEACYGPFSRRQPERHCKNINKKFCPSPAYNFLWLPITLGVSPDPPVRGNGHGPRWSLPVF